MSASETTELLKAVVTATCDSFGNLTVIVLTDKSRQPSFTTFEVRRKDQTVFFPAVAGRVSKDNSTMEINTELATSDSFSSAIEENAISDPLKVVISSRSWSANLVACGRRVQYVSKVSYQLNDVWQVDDAFCDMLKKLSRYGKLDEGSTKICCGITKEEYNFVAKRDALYQCNLRTYPGGAAVYETSRCELVFPISKWLSLPSYPFHRCFRCLEWLQRNLKRKGKAKVSTNGSTEDERKADTIGTTMLKKSYAPQRRSSRTIKKQKSTNGLARPNGETDVLTRNDSTAGENNSTSMRKQMSPAQRRSPRSIKKKMLTNGPDSPNGQTDKLFENDSTDGENNAFSSTAGRKKLSVPRGRSSRSAKRKVSTVFRRARHEIRPTREISESWKKRKIQNSNLKNEFVVPVKVEFTPNEDFDESTDVFHPVVPKIEIEY